MIVIYWFRILPETRLEAFNDCFITIVCWIGAYQAYNLVKRFDRTDEARICWLLFGVGLFLEGVGHAIYMTSEFFIGDTISFPFYSDYFIVAGEILYIVSFRSFLYHINQSDLLPKTHRRNLSNNIFWGIFIAQTVFYLIPTLKASTDSLWFSMLFLIYPTIDLVLAYYCLHLAMIFYSMGHSPVARPWVILVAAFFVFLITDTVYMHMESWDLYHPYLWINPGWGLAYLLISYAVLRQRKLMDLFTTMD